MARRSMWSSLIEWHTGTSCPLWHVVSAEYMLSPLEYAPQVELNKSVCFPSLTRSRSH